LSDPGPVLGSGARYRDELVAGGLLLATGVDGLYGFSHDLVRLIAGVETYVSAAGAGQYEVLRFPPVVPRVVLERAGYVRSFPDLVGAVRTFTGGDEAHHALLRTLDAGGDWTAGLGGSDVALCAAACQPLYPTIAPDLPAGGRRFDVCGYVFRHEPSSDVARMLSFRQYEYVYAGDEFGALAHRDHWIEVAAEMLSDLGLDVATTLASDPFFGRAGRALTATQREGALKYEVVAPTAPDAPTTAITSANCHLDHFCRELGIRTAAGETAHSSCVGFGLERIAFALLFAHGPNLGAWPDEVRARLAV